MEKLVSAITKKRSEKDGRSIFPKGHSICIVSWILLLFSLNCFALQKMNETTTVPMDLSTMVPNVELKINGEGPYRFDFDTGAGMSTISAQYAAILGLEVIGETSVSSPASTEPIMASIVNVPSVSLGDIHLSYIAMVKLDFGDMLSVDGILGLQPFSDYLVTIDYPGEKIVFDRGHLQHNSENVIPFGSMMSVHIDIGGTEKVAHLDTGCPASFAFPLAHQNTLKLKTPPTEMGRAGMIGASFKIWKAQLDGQIRVADIIFESPDIVLEDRPGDFITIGYPVLKELSITVDQKNSLIKLEKSHPVEKASKEGKRRTEDHQFCGRYGGVRSVTFENGALYIQRDGTIKMKLVENDDHLYRPELTGGMVPMNKLPRIRFERDDQGIVIGLTFVHDDGSEEFVPKDK
ncbi:MAG: clan AA aspartic protease [Gemmatimonadota bacterium]|nr:MAG: clan AA aspartic protease [Gemmatimonadota bacterium]